ncbi:aspartate/glutamate racemase family protein [Nocardioides sp.]|uniref:aspartate/glutamate racemase family protein n=1 Tax=Nocardioides sp. TaxID=35761 RepID=UPI0035AE7BBE
MTVYEARPNTMTYGYPIGMLCAEWNVPFIPGDLNNAWTFDFPIRYLSVKGAVGADVLAGRGQDYAHLFVEAAQQLESEGVRAITGNCGYMAAYQREVAAAVNIPVFMSSLLQLPLVRPMVAPDKKIAVMCASESTLSPQILESIGLTNLDGILIRGIDHHPHWNEVIIQERGTLDEQLLRSEVVATARAVVEEDPAVGGFLFECTDLPPYSAAVQQATGLPVFDAAGFIRYVFDAVAPRTYTGLF